MYQVLIPHLFYNTLVAFSILRLIRPYSKLIMAAAGILFIIGGTLFALKLARGYRPGIGKKGPTLTGTGLLVASSDPKGAQVYINSKLTTATDDTLNLTPGTYEVEIKKEGFTPWKKTLKITAELVTQTTTKLFLSVPNLTPLTFTGATNPLPSPDGQKIAYLVTSASVPTGNGVWVLDLSERNFSFARPSEPRQIARNTSQYNFSDANMVWTPDSNQLLAYWQEAESKSLKSPKELKLLKAILLSNGSMNDESDFKDVSARLPVLLSQWHQDLDLKEVNRLKELPAEMEKIATESAQAVYFSPDEQKIMYTARQEIEIPAGLKPDLPSESTQSEIRQLKTGDVYVYDIKEDKNFLIGEVAREEVSGVSKVPQVSQVPKVSKAEEAKTKREYWQFRLLDGQQLPTDLLDQPTPSQAGTTDQNKSTLPPVPNGLIIRVIDSLKNRYSPIWAQQIQWFPSSMHLLQVNDGSISIMEYDGTNNVTVYAGPFDQSFAYPWPNGGRLVVLASLNNDSPANLYAINLK